MTSAKTPIKERTVVILNAMGCPVHLAVARSGNDDFRFILSPGRVPLPMTGTIVHREDLAPNDTFQATGLSPSSIPIVTRKGWTIRPKLSLQQEKKDGVHLLIFILRPADSPPIGEAPS